MSMDCKPGRNAAKRLAVRPQLIRPHTHTENMQTANQDIFARILATKATSAWSKAVKAYALELMDDLEGDFTQAKLLNGAENWKAYSSGGCALIYDEDIAERLCSPSAFKRSNLGANPPNKDESWLDCQARALSQASRLAAKCARPESVHLVASIYR